MNGLTEEMVAAARSTPTGQYIDRLIAEDVARTGGQGFGGSIIQLLWDAMKAAGPRHGHLPEWAQQAVDAAAFASYPGLLKPDPNRNDYLIVGNTPTTGGKLTAADYDKWLKTIPEPIEPVKV